MHVSVWGFDTGGGMPAGTGDYRDHPDVWAPGDYRMDVAALTARMAARTALVLGEIRETVADEPIPSRSALSPSM